MFVYLKEKQLKDKVTFLILNLGIREGLKPKQCFGFAAQIKKQKEKLIRKMRNIYYYNTNFVFMFPKNISLLLVQRNLENKKGKRERKTEMEESSPRQGIFRVWRT